MSNEIILQSLDCISLVFNFKSDLFQQSPIPSVFTRISAFVGMVHGGKNTSMFYKANINIDRSTVLKVFANTVFQIGSCSVASNSKCSHNPHASLEICTTIPSISLHVSQVNFNFYENPLIE